MRRLIRRLLVALPVLVLALTAPSAGGAPRPPKLTVIGDSIADKLERNPVAMASLSNGFRVNLQTAGCRRLVALGCATDDNDRSPPPSVLDVIHRFGPWLGRVVVIESGYNDPPIYYGQDLDAVMGALQDARIKTVVWLTVHDPRHTLRLENRAILAAPKRWTQLVVADWNAYSANQPDWYQPDNIHLTPLGAIRLARFIHTAVVAALQPLRSPTAR